MPAGRLADGPGAESVSPVTCGAGAVPLSGLLVSCVSASCLPACCAPISVRMTCGKVADASPKRAPRCRSVDKEPNAEKACGQRAARRRDPRGRQGANPALPWSEMDEPSGSESTGMGPTPSGPSFVPWAPAPGDTPPTRPYPTPSRPTGLGSGRPSRVPTLITAAVIFVVVAVVAIASYVAHFADTHVSAPVVSKQPLPQVSAQGDRIEFTTTDGSGQLILLRHSWVSYGQAPPTSGSYLRVEVELICVSGSIDYDPYNFQVFDQNGRLFETAIEGAGYSMLQSGTLRPGDRVSGTIAFDMPRSEATLLMSDSSNQTVTALKVPD